MDSAIWAAYDPLNTIPRYYGITAIDQDAGYAFLKGTPFFRHGLVDTEAAAGQ